MNKPLLVLGYGNPGRGDDGLGPAFVEAIEAMQLPHADAVQDMQLQIEHITDLQGRATVVIVDADVSCTAPYQWEAVLPEQDASYSSHAMSPQALLYAYSRLYAAPPPDVQLLRVRGYQFELGDSLSEAAQCNLRAALQSFTDRYADAILAGHLRSGDAPNR